VLTYFPQAVPEIPVSNVYYDFSVK